MRINDITLNTIANGVGVRDVVWVQGCYHKCPECHNPSTHDPLGGKEMPIWEIAHELMKTNNNVTVSGGEPLDQINELLVLTYHVRLMGKTMWLYTGYTIDMQKLRHEVFDYIDVVVDGEFHIDEKDISLPFRGSANQRIIDVKESRKANEIVIWKYPEPREVNYV